MPLPSQDPVRHWALYAQSTQVMYAGEPNEYTSRQQLIVLPPVSGKPAYETAGTYRYFSRYQRKLDERTRWTGPYGREFPQMKTTAESIIDSWERQGYTDIIMVTVPMSDKELLDLRYERKKTEYRVIDRARKIIKKKYKKDIR